MALRTRALFAAIGVAAFVLVERGAAADVTAPPEAISHRPESVNVTSPFDRPHTVAEIEAGFIALPGAPISASQKGGDVPFVGRIGTGDATFQTGLHLLYRASPEFALGAGFMFAPSPKSDDDYGRAGGLTGLRRSHSRSYLLIATEGRYVPLRTKTLEAWVGVTFPGLIVISDRFKTDEGDAVPEILGRKDYSMRTEGFAVGVQAGGTWMFAERWVAGVDARADRWILPSSPQCSPIGDCTTLTGSVTALELGLTIGYRIPL